MDEKLRKTDIYKLYDLYANYKLYYDFYWNYGIPGGKTQKECKEKLAHMLEYPEAAEDNFEILCWFAGVNPFDVKELNGFDTLRYIERENFYGKTDDKTKNGS